MADQTALLAWMKTVIDAGKDTVAVLQPGETWSARLLQFENLLPDFLAAAASSGDLSAEVASLQPADYLSLAASLVTDMAFTNAHAQAIVTSLVQLLKDSAASVVPDVLTLLAVIKNPPVVAAAA